jgi:hypothetical protein
MSKVSIIGCGWLGLRLSQSLKKSYEVECFSKENTKDNSLFWQAQTLIIAINTKNNYLNTLKKIIKLTPLDSNIILMSSTSVYREFDGEVDEDTKITDIKLQREAELLVQNSKKNTLILRLGGLMGEDRISGKWKNISTFSDGEVNYIHRDDVISIVKNLIGSDIRNGIYNLVAPFHPLRSQVHKKNANKFNFELGTFKGKTSRIVKSHKIIKDLNYKFIHPNPLEFWD